MKTVLTHPEIELRALLLLMASNRMTLGLLVSLGLSVLFVYNRLLPNSQWLIMLSVVLLLMNFILAMWVKRVLINNPPLLLFHFALIALVIFLVLGNMTYLKATLELTTMEEFTGRLENVRAGAWHDYGLTDIRFTNMGFDINYHKGIKRNNTINRIMLKPKNGSAHLLEIGDHRPLVIGHYRFYTSHNKGFAPVFEWTAAHSQQPITGSVHLPAYPINEYRQALEWTLPGSTQSIWTMLQIEESVLPEDQDFQFRIPQKHRLIVRHNEQRYELKVGDELALDNGVLRYKGLSTWMGYKVDYDWTRPWLLASCLVAIVSLCVHFIRKFRG